MNPPEDSMIAKLLHHFGDREARSISRILREALTEAEGDRSLLDKWVMRILSGEPVQYVVGYTWFYGRKFMVDDSVLIPRPETEELVDRVLKHAMTISNPSILDIGTGSGCIAVTLAAELGVTVDAIEVSGEAIEVARINTQLHSAEVTLLHLDILKEKPLQRYDIIVSNPPYVKPEEFEVLDGHVREHEPSIALMAGGSDAFVFYRRIAVLGKELLSSGGALWLELNAMHPKEIEEIVQKEGYNTQLFIDLQGEVRFLKAYWKEVSAQDSLHRRGSN